MRRNAEQNARRAAAAIAGAIDGFLNAIDEYDLATNVEESAQEAGKVVRAVTDEGVTQADTPEARAAAARLRQAGSATLDAGVRARDAVVGGVTTAKESVQSTARDVSYNVREKVENVRDAAHNFQEEVKVRAEAVGESGRRARAAPRRVGRELAAAFRSWRQSFVTTLAAYLLIGAIAITAWVLLTIGLVVALNNLTFDPLGTFLVVLLYAIVAGIAYAIAKARRAAAQRETDRRMANSREEIRRVGRPVREAFAGRGRAGF